MRIDVKRWAERMKQYRYPLLILLVGLFLLLLPGKSEPTARASPAQENSAETEQRQLESILEQIDGVGTASVLLAYRASEETEYLTDDDGTVIVSSGGGTQSALVCRTLEPQFRGAVVVCTGGGNATVKLQVVEAVSKYTGLGAAEISVFPSRSGN